MLSRPCLPQAIRDFRIETICGAAGSSSLKEMELVDMVFALLADEIIGRELAAQRLISCARELGEIELDSVLYGRDERLAQQVGEVITSMARLS